MKSLATYPRDLPAGNATYLPRQPISSCAFLCLRRQHTLRWGEEGGARLPKDKPVAWHVEQGVWGPRTSEAASNQHLNFCLERSGVLMQNPVRVAMSPFAFSRSRPSLHVSQDFLCAPISFYAVAIALGRLPTADTRD